jgi:hypothetical protein
MKLADGSPAFAHELSVKCFPAAGACFYPTETGFKVDLVVSRVAMMVRL